MSFKPALTSSCKLAVVALCVAVFSGCATNHCYEGDKARAASNAESGATTQTCAPASTPLSAVVATPTKLVALGYGAPGTFPQYTPGQQKLMAMRAAQVDAYRNLAEQVYGFRVWGNTAVSAFTTQNDIVRTYVDAFIRGARLVNMSTITDGNFEATVELEVSQSFIDSLNRQVGNISRPSPATACGTPVCPASSAHYVSN
jgi:hypothetical protein